MSIGVSWRKIKLVILTLTLWRKWSISNNCLQSWIRKMWSLWKSRIFKIFSTWGSMLCFRGLGTFFRRKCGRSRPKGSTLNFFSTSSPPFMSTPSCRPNTSMFLDCTTVTKTTRSMPMTSLRFTSWSTTSLPSRRKTIRDWSLRAWSALATKEISGNRILGRWFQRTRSRNI